MCHIHAALICFTMVDSTFRFFSSSDVLFRVQLTFNFEDGFPLHHHLEGNIWRDPVFTATSCLPFAMFDLLFTMFHIHVFTLLTVDSRVPLFTFVSLVPMKFEISVGGRTQMGYFVGDIHSRGVWICMCVYVCSLFICQCFYISSSPDTQSTNGLATR